MSYTKGEWKVVAHHYERQDSSGTMYRIETADEVIAELYSKSDAQLIASVPDLYEALRDLAVVVECGEHHKGTELDNAFKALAKAEGKGG